MPSSSSARERELEALHEVAVASSGVLDPVSLGVLVVTRARDLLGGDDATLLLWDDTAQGLRVLADTHVPPFSRTIASGEGTAGMAFERAEAVAVEDYPRWKHAVKDSIPRGLKSVVASPLLVQSKPIGALTVSFNTARRFQGQELRLLALLATQIAPALEAARLYDALVGVSKKLEETNAALKDANRHKSIFLANMSHELRTPLNAIIGFSELLTDARDGQFDGAARKRFLEQILMSGRHLLALINDILDLSKVEAGRMELKLESFAVGGLVEQVMQTVEPLAAKKNLSLASTVAVAGPVVADPGRVKQMLLNLTSNAIKFTPDGGRITISAARNQDRIEISVADTGIGIAESDQHRIFQEFEQIDQGSGRRQEGTGLGLALTKRLALLHGGDIRFSSQAGKGSVFTIILPSRALSAGPSQPRGSSAGAGPLVLVVEDDAAAAQLLTRQLASAGYRVEVARSGEEALRRARESRPAAITLDIILPQLDGWEVITRLKSDESTSSIPIVIVSVVDNPELGSALGAVDYFVKPVDAKALVGRLNRLDVRRDIKRDPVRILVVDDEAANRTWLTEVLEPEGFRVVLASGGLEAIQLARSQRPDLVLLDLMMPEVSGFDVVEALRSDQATSEVPIMVLTAASLTEADKRQLNGRVSTILSRHSTGSSDLVSLLSRVVKPA
ncbi:MAG TPA: response regulator [Candidatus Limnocylindrales bacterium]|nr:response regulator [Candidatus Limnocylindrales bacterium]